METTEKKWYTSVTIISSIIAILSGILGDSTLGQVISDPAAAANIANAITGVAGMLAIWGRVRSTKTIGKKVV